MITEMEMLAALKQKLETEGIFNDIRTLNNEIGYTSLFDTLPDLTRFPAAVLGTGSMTMENGGYTSRTLVDVVVIDTYYGNETKVEESRNVLKKAMEALNCNAFSQPLCLNNVHYIFDRIEKLKLNDEHIAWRIQLTAKAVNF